MKSEHDLQGYRLIKEKELNNILLNASIKSKYGALINELNNKPVITLAEKNVKDMQKVIKDIRDDVEATATRATKLEPFLNEIGIYIDTNPLLAERYVEGTLKVASNTYEAYNIGSKGLPLGGSRELYAEVAKQDTMGYLTKLGGDMQKDLKGIVETGLKEGKGIRDIAGQMDRSVQSLGTTRAEAIARTETVRAVNDGKFEAAVDKGYDAFIVVSADDCCELCADTYSGQTFTMDDKDMLPPLHVNCRCSAEFFRTSNLADDNASRIEDKRLNNEDATQPTEDRVNTVVPETLTPPSLESEINK